VNEEHVYPMSIVMRTIVAALAVAAAAPAVAQPTPANGTEVLRQMHDAYAGKWYHTLVFQQKTTTYRNGTPAVATWYESLRHTADHGTQLRIDIGAPSLGNGMLYTADSAWVMRNGTLASMRDRGNEFLPMIEGVYVQPLDVTIAQVGRIGFDLGRVAAGQWRGRPVWIVGAASASDSTSPQFWVDRERNVVVRMLIAGAPDAAPMDIHLDGYEPVGGGWLATKVAMYIDGAPRQLEEYSGWRADLDLAPGLFDPATWTTAPHWLPTPSPITSHIQRVSADLLRVEEGSLYPALHRMEQDGWLRAEWGITDKNREAKFYTLTAAGHKQLALEEESWLRLRDGVTRVLRYA
jgi:transcriptional regulator